ERKNSSSMNPLPARLRVEAMNGKPCCPFGAARTPGACTNTTRSGDSATTIADTENDSRQVRAASSGGSLFLSALMPPPQTKVNSVCCHAASHDLQLLRTFSRLAQVAGNSRFAQQLSDEAGATGVNDAISGVNATNGPL